MDHITELFCILDDFCKIFNESLEEPSYFSHLSDEPINKIYSPDNVARKVSLMGYSRSIKPCMSCC